MTLEWEDMERKTTETVEEICVDTGAVVETEAASLIFHTMPLAKGRGSVVLTAKTIDEEMCALKAASPSKIAGTDVSNSNLLLSNLFKP